MLPSLAGPPNGHLVVLAIVLVLVLTCDPMILMMPSAYALCINPLNSLMENALMEVSGRGVGEENPSLTCRAHPGYESGLWIATDSL